jgi:uncharacterized protein
MSSFIPDKNSTKNGFFSYILTIVFTFIALALSSNIPIFIFRSKNQNAEINIENLIDYFGKNNYFLLQLLPFVFALFTLIFCYKFIHKLKVKNLFTLKKRFSIKNFFLSFFILGFFLTLVFLFQVNKINSEIKWNFHAYNFLILTGISLIFVSIQTLFEEILFRAYLLQGFLKVFPKKWLGILISSVLFGLMHINNPEISIFGKEIVFYFIYTGLFLSLLTFYSKGIEISFGFHTMNNLFATLILTNNWQVFQTDAIFKDYTPPSLSFEFWFSVFIVYPIIFIIFMKIQKWKLGSIFD